MMPGTEDAQRPRLIHPFIAILMVAYLFHWPNQLLAYSELADAFVKTPLLVVTFLLALKSGGRAVRPFLPAGLLMLGMAVSYATVRGVFFHSYMFRAALFTLLCGVVVVRPGLGAAFVKVAVWISALLAVQTVCVVILWLLEIGPQYHPVAFVGGGGPRPFNLFLGFQANPNYFRVQSYFTESNRLAYFLTPSFFASFHLGRRDVRYRALFYLIGVAVFFTFSVFSLAAIGACLLALVAKKRGRLTLAVLALLAVVPAVVLLIQFDPEFWLTMFNKSGSYRTRLLGIQGILAVVWAHPFGTPEGVDALLDARFEGGNSTLTLLYWIHHAGVQSMLFLVPLLLYWLKRLGALINSADEYANAIGFGALAFFLEQSFYGTYFEFYFIAVMATVSAYALHLTRRRQGRGRESERVAATPGPPRLARQEPSDP